MKGGGVYGCVYLIVEIAYSINIERLQASSATNGGNNHG